MARQVSRGHAFRAAITTAIACAFFVAAPTADAAITSVFSNTATPIPCVTQGSGARLCDQTTFAPAQPRSAIKTFDSVPIDVRVAFPPEPASGPDGPYPLIMMFHGYAGSKLSLANMQPFLDRGYATFSMTTRGFGQSCGTATSRTELGAACNAGYVRLMDTRYEVRDAQELAGMLADEGRTSFNQIGAIGGSYGGGMSMALAALKDRKMLPDGSLAPWQSPNGTPMQIAAATPEIPWTDLAYSLTPNGKTLDYVADASYQGRTGVLKSSWENALYNSGLSFNYAAAGADPDADLRNWHTTFNAGEPYDDASGNPLPAFVDIRDELTTHHSSYYIDHSEVPAPMLISNGFTDDLFPVDEALRFYNRTRTQYPGALVSLFFASLGHQRGQNKAADLALRSAAEFAWLDYFVKGVGSFPFLGVQAVTQTCPNSAASGGPYSASTWAALAPGEVRLDDPAPKTILPTAGSSAIAATFDPITGGGACATNSAADQADTATYRTEPIPAGGYTLLGSPTVVADITSPGSDSQVAARLLDVDPGTNTQTLVARGLWRPAITSSPVRQVFQLHPNGYKFAAGHVAKLELLPKDSGTVAGNSYGRASNNQQNVTVENLELRLPVVEQAGALGGLVEEPAQKVVPPGYQLASDYTGTYVRPKGATPFRVPLVPAFAQCTAPDRTHGAPLAFPSCSSPDQLSPNLTIGTPDANGTGANSAGSVLMQTIVGDPSTAADESDVNLSISLTDVRQAAGLDDYTGELQEVSTLRITDRASSPTGNVGATVQDLPIPVTVPCAATPETTKGGSCSISTTVDSVIPNAVQEGKRAVWELAQVQVFDGGPDGVAATTGNSLFAVQGVYTP
jgi:predicted acyl esterase